jgi:hypothetical protein
MQHHRQIRTHALIAIVAIAAALAVLTGARRAAAEGPYGADAGDAPGLAAPHDADAPDFDPPNLNLPPGFGGGQFDQGAINLPEGLPTDIGPPIDGVPLEMPEGLPGQPMEEDSGGFVPED